MRFGVAGKPDKNLVSLLPPEIQLVAIEEAGAELQGVLIDAATAQPDAREIAAWLHSGKSVAILGMTSVLANVMESIVGNREAEGTPLVVYQQVPGSMPPDFHAVVMGSIVLQAEGAVEADDSNSAEQVVPVAESAPSAFLPLGSLVVPERKKPLLMAGSNSYDAPIGAMWGRTDVKKTISASLGNLWGGKCDKRGNELKKNQECRGTMDIDFYGYWADGEANPFYILVAQQQYDFNPTTDGNTPAERTCAWDGWSRAWFMHTIETRRLKPEVVGSGARNEDIQLVGWGPKGLNEKQDSFETQFTATLRRDGPGGARTKAVVTLGSGQITNNFPGWSSLDKSDAAARTSFWQYCQKSGWDSRAKPTGNFSQWWTDIYEPGGSYYVKDMFPEQSRRQFLLRTVSVWRIQCPSAIDPVTRIAPPPPLTVKLSGGLDVHMVGFHSHDGCTKRTNHMLPFGVSGEWEKTIDMQQLVLP